MLGTLATLADILRTGVTLKGLVHGTLDTKRQHPKGYWDSKGHGAQEPGPPKHIAGMAEPFPCPLFLPAQCSHTLPWPRSCFHPWPSLLGALSGSWPLWLSFCKPHRLTIPTPSLASWPPSASSSLRFSTSSEGWQGGEGAEDTCVAEGMEGPRTQHHL